MKKVWWL